MGGVLDGTHRMSPDQVSCQQQEAREFSRLFCPRWLVLARRLVWHLRTSGVKLTARKAWHFVKRDVPAARGRGRSSAQAKTGAEALGLQPGEWVEVKSEAEVLDTLDLDRKHKGLSFLPEMSLCHGRQFKVYKRVNRIFLEESRQIRRMRNTVLLEGVRCEGTGIGCDRSCYFYWREAWLRRAAAPGSAVSQSEAECAENIPGANLVHQR